MNFWHWLDAWNAKRDGLEATGGAAAILVGVVLGIVIGTTITSAQVRYILEACVRG